MAAAPPASDSDVLSFCCGLQRDRLALLFRDPSVVQAVFRALPPLAQQYVLRLLHSPAPISEKSEGRLCGMGRCDLWVAA